MHVLGTAGHVDHGKSSLVLALTGTNPDRWLEERLRGMTLDLGFAHLKYDDGVEAGIVDVPGHERFLHNMLAGAAGMELLLLVIAANEGPRPQTLEHLAILQYLNVRRTLVVLTKSDLVDADELAFTRELVREALAGTIAADAFYYPVSTVNGDGLDALRAAIHDELLALPPRNPDAPAYLPVDRVFALAGHGTIVTGTLMQGRIATGDDLLLSPPGRSVRIRSLQVFGERRDRIDGGARVAANLPGVETTELARGAVLASAQFPALSTFEVRFRPLPGALSMLRRRTPVRAYVGSAEVLGTLAFDTVPVNLEERAARLHVRTPLVAFPGAAFVVRRLSPKDLLGGGTIAAAAPAADASAGETPDAPDVAALLVSLRDAGLEGATPAKLGATANVREDVAERELNALAEDGRALRLAKPAAFVEAALVDATFARIRERLEANERETPWACGATSLALSRALAISEGPFLRILALLAEEGRVAHRAGYYATPGFVPELSAEQRAFFDRVFAADATQPFVPVPFTGVLEQVKAARITGLSQAFDTLFASGALVKVADDVYRADQIAAIRGKLESTLRQRRQLTMAEFRDEIGTSRKYAVPLLEWFDAAGVTLRNGDLRVLRGTSR